MTTISSIMTARVTTVAPDLPLYDLICLLLDHNVGGAPVVDAHGRAIGMVSKSDLIWEDHDWAESQRTEGQRQPWRLAAGEGGLFDDRALTGRTVADVMTSRAVSVLPTATIPEAARLMAQNRIHRLPVVDPVGVLVGIVTTFDITRWVADKHGAGRP